MDIHIDTHNLRQQTILSDRKNGNVYIWFTFPIALLLAVASLGGIFIEGLYRDNPYFIAQGKGQDLVSLTIVLPTVITAAVLAKKGLIKAKMIWIGALVYLVYTYAIASFSVKFNPLSPIYIALLGLSLYGMITGLAEINESQANDGSSNHIQRKFISIYMLSLSFLFYFLWLKESIPAAIAGIVPQSVLENGTPTNAVYVLDMAWILPAFAITGISVWRRMLCGYLLTGIMLSYINLLLLALLSMMIFLSRGGYPLALPQTLLFVVLLIANLGISISFFNKGQIRNTFQEFQDT